MRGWSRISLAQRSLQEGGPACHTGKIYSRIVQTKIQHLLPEDVQGRQSGGIKGGSTSVPQIVLLFFHSFRL